METSEIKKELEKFDVGEIVLISKFSLGVINDNFLVQTDERKYVLRIYNFKKTKHEVVPELETLSWLQEANFPSPKIVTNHNNERVIFINNKPGVLFNYIKGRHLFSNDVDSEIILQVGSHLGRFHRILKDKQLSVKKPGWGVDSLTDLFNTHEKRIRQSTIKDADLFMDLISNELRTLKQDSNLTQGIIHPDIKPENVLFERKLLTGILDFDDITESALIDNIAITIIWWCFNNGKLQKDLYETMLYGYQSEFSLSGEELALIPKHMKSVALKGILSWCYKVLHRPDNAYTGAKEFYDIYQTLKKT